MTAFHRNTLGFDVTAEVASADEDVDAEALATLVGLPDAGLSAAFLGAPGCAVELVKYHEPSGEPVTTSRSRRPPEAPRR